MSLIDDGLPPGTWAFQRITLRISVDLHARLYGSAQKNTCSMNAEIIKRLEASFKNQEEASAAILALKESSEKLGAAIQLLIETANAANKKLDRARKLGFDVDSDG